jgi:DNA polymerase
MTELENLSEAESPSAETVDVRKAIVQQLESLRTAGLTHLPSGTGAFEIDFDESAISNQPDASPAQTDTQTSTNSKSSRVTDSTTQSPSQPEMIRESPSSLVNDSVPVTAPTPTNTPIQHSSGAYGPSLPLNDRKDALNVLRSEIEQCTRCEELSSKRTQTVFGVGNPAARLVFVGEGPGFHEDRMGEPFVGDAGDQLNKIIKACKLSREEVFILNCVKCRPPGNRNPSQDELANCWGYAERQLEILQPEYIVCLGSVAAKTLLKTTQSLGRLRKQFHSYRGSRVLVTYHPAYLLRTPSAKRHVWEDMKMLMKEMGIDWTK